MLEISSFPENLVENRQNEQEVEVDGTAAATASVLGGFTEEERASLGGEEGERNWNANNRWPREETVALIKIRSEMDAAFRDTSPKAPLWEEVSKKLGELGYNRSAKKCKEKFENIYKYHRRTKDGRSGRINGKHYRFFDQLEALESNPLPIPSPENDQAPAAGTVTAANMAMATSAMDPQNVIPDAIPCSVLFPSANMSGKSTSMTSSSSKELGEGEQKKKRKLSQFFENLMKQVVEKQEDLHKKFMEVLEKCEQDRLAREEAWKIQELARLKRERELLIQERSIAAAKDEAVLAFLKKISEQSGSVQLPENLLGENSLLDDRDKDKEENSNSGNIMGDKQESLSGGNLMHMSSSRWPKDEVEALIRFRSNLDSHYQGTLPKGPLWEEISSAMKRLGYNRSAKRCKEKWENINKYFKRMKERNKERPEDSKTCPYYHQLKALYSNKKPKKADDSTSASSGNNELKPEELLMHIMGGQAVREQPESSKHDGERNNNDKYQVDNEDGEGDRYQLIDNSPSQMAIMG